MADSTGPPLPPLRRTPDAGFEGCVVRSPPPGVGGAVAGHPSRRAARLAEGQRLPPPRPPAADAFLPRLFQEHLQNPHGDGEHLDTPAG